MQEGERRVTCVFIRQRKPNLRNEEGFVPDSWFQRFGPDTAIVTRDFGGTHITSYADLGREKRELQSRILENKRSSGRHEIRPLYVWAFHCPGFAFMGWWVYLIGRGISVGKHLRGSRLLNKAKDTTMKRKQGDTILNPLEPSLPLLMKLGSIIVHAEEAISPLGHTFDIEAMKPMLRDPEVQAWIKAMGVYLPLKR
jgi:hypothetical protein